MKTLRNFLIANLCAMVPLWWALFGWMPDQVRICMRGTEAPGSIVASGTALLGEDLGEWKGGRVFRFYLRKDMKWDALAFRLPGNSGTAGVERIELQKWKLVSFRKTGAELVPSGDVPGEYVFNSSRFGRMGIAAGKVSLGLAFLEIAVLGISWWCAKRYREERWRNLFPPLLCVTVTLAFLMQMALPLQSYWANRSSYPFPSRDLVEALVIRFMWIWMLAIASVGLLVRYFGRWVLGVVFAFSVCIYLESGILSTGLANLNGDIWLLMNSKRALWDAMVWLAVFAMVVTSYPVLKKHYLLAAICLLAMVTASMFDTTREPLADKSKLIVDDFVSFETVLDNVSYSTNRNVLVFILDSLESETAHAVLEDSDVGSMLREKFRGFTEYTNNVGALPQTLTAVPNLLTGRYPDNTIFLEDYTWSCYAEDSVVNVFLKTGYNVYITTPGLGCGFASQRMLEHERDQVAMSVLHRLGTGGTAWSVLDFSRWRWMPFAVKASCSALIALHNKTTEPREWGVYPQLAKAGISTDSFGTFLLIHTAGLHVPVCWNRYGEMLATGNNSERECIEQGVLVLGCLANLMDSYREKGIYDNSLILALGDHGQHKERLFRQDKNDGRLPGNARPFLWVKPMESFHEFTSSDLPTGHAQVADLLKKSVRQSLSECEIQTILQSDQRIYRRMALLEDGWTDWIVKRDGSFQVQRHNVIPSEQSGRPLECGHMYSLNWRKAGQLNVDLTFEGVVVDGFPLLYRDTPGMTIELRVPHKDKRYVLELDTFDANGGVLRFRCDTTGDKWTVFPVKPFSRIVLHNVKSDETGIARVCCERVDGPNVDVAFTSLLLKEEP